MCHTEKCHKKHPPDTTCVGFTAVTVTLPCCRADAGTTIPWGLRAPEKLGGWEENLCKYTAVIYSIKDSVIRVPVLGSKSFLGLRWAESRCSSWFWDRRCSGCRNLCTGRSPSPAPAGVSVTPGWPSPTVENRQNAQKLNSSISMTFCTLYVYILGCKDILWYQKTIKSKICIQFEWYEVCLILLVQLLTCDLHQHI